MTEIEQKVNLIVKYIFDKTGININNIILFDGEDLAKLDYAYNIAFEFYNTKK